MQEERLPAGGRKRCKGTPKAVAVLEEESRVVAGPGVVFMLFVRTGQRYEFTRF